METSKTTNYIWDLDAKYKRLKLELETEEEIREDTRRNKNTIYLRDMHLVEIPQECLDNLIQALQDLKTKLKN